MIDDVDRRLRDWVTSVVGPTELSLGPPPPAAQSGKGVSVYLLGLVSNPPTRSSGPSPLQIALRYLVTSWAEAPEDAHRLLGDLVFAAMDDEDFEVVLEPPSDTVWGAFGSIPRPSFVLKVPLRKERHLPAAKRVREMVVDATSIASLYGVVLGPGAVPLEGALVEVPQLQLAERTDRLGRFRFVTVPAGRPLSLRARARGYQMAVIASPPTSITDPLVITFDSLEG